MMKLGHGQMGEAGERTAAVKSSAAESSATAAESGRNFGPAVLTSSLVLVLTANYGARLVLTIKPIFAVGLILYIQTLFWS